MVRTARTCRGPARGTLSKIFQLKELEYFRGLPPNYLKCTKIGAHRIVCVLIGARRAQLNPLLITILMTSSRSTEQYEKGNLQAIDLFIDGQFCFGSGTSETNAAASGTWPLLFSTSQAKRHTPSNVRGAHTARARHLTPCSPDSRAVLLRRTTAAAAAGCRRRRSCSPSHAAVAS